MRLDPAHTPEAGSLRAWERWAREQGSEDGQSGELHASRTRRTFFGRRRARRLITEGYLDATRLPDGTLIVTRHGWEQCLARLRVKPTAHARERLAEVQRRREQRR